MKIKTNLIKEAKKLVAEFPYCVWCNRKFNSARALKIHCTKKHGNQAPYFDLWCSFYNLLIVGIEKREKWEEICKVMIERMKRKVGEVRKKDEY